MAAQAQCVGVCVRTPVLQAKWVVALYPDAAEAGGSLVYTGPSPVSASREPDPARARLEAGRRARTKVRRYCASNRLNRLGTLTYGGDGCHDERQVRRDVGKFFRALRTSLGSDPLPYLWVPEWHPGGHGLHVHFAVGRFVRRSLIDEAWGRGFVHIKLLGDISAGAGDLSESRMAARYLAKYVTKTSPDSSGAGLHRYEVAEGFQPRKVAFTGRTGDQALAAASAAMAGEPERVWWSAEDEAWVGPPAVWASWAA